MNGPSAASQTYAVVGGTRYPIPPHGLRIGRAPDNDVVLPDPNVSRQHVVIWATPRGAFLRDLGSQNGTFIGSRRIGNGPEVIPSGTRVRVGTTEMLVEARGAGSAGRSGRRSAWQIAALVAGAAVAVVALLAVSGFLAVQLISGGRTTAGARPTAAPVSTVAAQGGSATGPAGVASPASAASPAAGGSGGTGAGANAPVSAPTAIARTGGRDPGLVRALGASVRIVVPLGAQRQASIGSGTIVTPRGHILTNYHVVSCARRKPCGF